MMPANSRLPADDLSQGGAPDGSRGCGARLRKAREAAGLTEADVADRLKMPVRVVRSLEAEDWSRLGAPVFVRGQLRSYSRLLGLTTAPMMAASGVAPIEPPMLVPRSFTPPMQRLMEQMARRLVYIVLTAAIAVPVWLATRPHLGVVSHDAAPLDVPASVGQATDRGASDAADPSPLVASLTPLPADTMAAPAMTLQLTGDSWVEVASPTGSIIEQSLLHAGARLAYPAGTVGRIVIGNAGSVQVRYNGQPVDLAAYARSNVARFAVSSRGSLVPVAD
jgi:cytoskeleton protein RodZ